MTVAEYGLHPTLSRVLNDRTFTPEHAGRVLDVGCGKGVLGSLMRTYQLADQIDGIEAHIDYYEHCVNLQVYDRIWHPIARRVDFLVATEEHSRIEYELYLDEDEANRPLDGGME